MQITLCQLLKQKDIAENVCDTGVWRVRLNNELHAVLNGVDIIKYVKLTRLR